MLIVRNFGRRDAALTLWNLRRAPRQVTSKTPLLHCPNINFSINPIVNCVNIRPKYFANLVRNDLERLKNDEEWLSDSHVTLCLL